MHILNDTKFECLVFHAGPTINQALLYLMIRRHIRTYRCTVHTYMHVYYNNVMSVNIKHTNQANHLQQIHQPSLDIKMFFTPLNFPTYKY